MSEPSGRGNSLSGWTMVNSKGEVPSDDESQSSGSSAEIVNLPEENKESKVCHPVSLTTIASEQRQEQEHNGLPPLPLCDDTECDEEIEVSSERSQGVEKEATADFGHVSMENLTETDGGLGACCVELMMKEGDFNKTHPYSCKNTEDLGTDEKENNSSVPLHASASSIAFQNEETNRSSGDKVNNDSDSDFVEINEDNLEEFEVEIALSRNNTPDRNPSIAEGFNFLGLQGGNMNNFPIYVFDEEMFDDDRDLIEDFNEDTESSAEDIGDDRIESDQSDVISNSPLSDVGDLSAFADIADLPLIAGDVARNYCHRPNNRLSSALNITLVVVALLTMGISIGLIMATDLEIEEWQNAYHAQSKKIESLEWTLSDIDRVLQEAKSRVNAHESVVNLLRMAGKQNDNSFKFLEKVSGMVNDFESCSKIQGSLPTTECHAQIMPHVQQSLTYFTPDIKKEIDNNNATDRTFDNSDSQVEKNPFICNVNKEMQQSLAREQERALHWQNLYLLERRQREWERENEVLEDERDRAQWEKEDEEEDRRERERWEKEDEEEDRRKREEWEKEDEREDRRERERWEKEEAENDKRERLLWEQQEEEEDRRDREKWEKERAEIDGLECLKKLMSTNLTVLKQHFNKWNFTDFDNFINTSKVMSNVDKLKQSVLVSVQQIWTEAEKALSKMGNDIKNGKKSYLDTSVMANYLRQSLAILQSQFDNAFKFDSNYHRANEERDEETHNKENKKREFERDEKVKEEDSYNNKKPNSLNKMFGKIFKKTSKSLRKFVRSVTTSLGHVKGFWDLKLKAPRFMQTEQRTTEESMNHFPSWVFGESCKSELNNKERNDGNVMVDIGSPCLWDTRNYWNNLMLKEPCLPEENRYSLGCNVDENTILRLKKDLKEAVKASGQLLHGRVNLIQGENMLKLFESFWKSWGKEDLLMKFDKDWAYCQLRQWSHFMSKNKGGKPVEISNYCNRLFNFKHVLKDVRDRKTYTENSRKKNIEVNEQGDKDKSDKETTSYNDDVVKDKPGKPKIHPGKVFERNQSNIFIDLDDHDDYQQTTWYLQRAQHRLKMRRDHEKSNTWLFDLYEHREDMRKVHSIPAKSTQWLFDKAEDRELQRRRDHQSDWLFERAKHRREEFTTKWYPKSHNKFKGRENDEKSKQKDRRPKEDMRKHKWRKNDVRGGSKRDSKTESDKSHTSNRRENKQWKNENDRGRNNPNYNEKSPKNKKQQSQNRVQNKRKVKKMKLIKN